MYKKATIGFSVLFIIGVLVGFIGLPALMHNTIRQKITLKPGTQTRKMWEKFPIPLFFKAYIFNVTNIEEVQNGGKPIVQEIGPFVFEEWKDKYNVQDIEEEDAVTYNMRNTFLFKPELGLSGEELVTVAHPLIQVMAIAVKRDRPPMINLVAEGINAIFQPKTPFITARFMDLFFRGIDIDCSSENFAAKAICLNFHTGAVKGAVKVNETHFKFSLMGGSNHTDAGFFKVSRGVRTAGTVGAVIEYDGETEISNWNGENCNKIRGTDSTIFAPFAKRDEALLAFSADLCVSLAPKFVEYTRYAGIAVLRYTLDFGYYKYEPENHCYCKHYPDNCPPKGLFDLSPCNEAPMFASLPHFLNSDPQLVTAVDGLCPTEEAHGIYLDYEIVTGTPLNVARRLQFSLDVHPVPEVEVMKDMRKLIMPYFWIEESASLGPEYTNPLKQFFLILKINNIFKWFAVLTGFLGFVINLYLYFAQKASRVSVVAPPTTEGGEVKN